MSGVPSGTHVFPPIVVRNVLRANWDALNTSLTEAPFIHTGWYGDTTEGPQVTVTNPTETSEIVATDGETGEPVLEVGGTVLVGCWGGELTDDSTGPDAQQVAHEFREEVRRVIHGYAAGIEETDGTRPISRLEDMGAQWQVDPDRSPPVVRYDVIVAYMARKRPPE